MIDLHDSTWERLLSMIGAASFQRMPHPEGLSWFLPTWLAVKFLKVSERRPQNKTAG